MRPIPDEAALALAAEGLPVFPLCSDKRPACPGGFYAAKSDSAGIRNLWGRHPGPLVGVPTGSASGLDVLDIDAPRHPEAGEWLGVNESTLPPTRIHRTRSGGLHILFRHVAGLRCWTGRPVPGIDGRAEGGYIVWWPAFGMPTVCANSIAPWPDWLLVAISPPPRSSGGRQALLYQPRSKTLINH